MSNTSCWEVPVYWNVMAGLCAVCFFIYIEQIVAENSGTELAELLLIAH